MATESLNIRGKDPDWIRRYPPMLTLVVALFIGATVLPSALNLPQSNPSTVLEYAPVPPDDSNPPPNSEGSLSSLGAASSGGLSTGVGELKQQEQQKKGGRSVDKPTVKQCVQHPEGLKQTEDPNSPPCVPFFDGDNGGATSQGVTENEVTIIVYTSTSISIDDNRGENNGQTPPEGSYCDVDSAEGEDENCRDSQTGEEYYRVGIVRALSRFFNERFQTYGRHVHFYIYYSSGCAGVCTTSYRRSTAADNWERYKPFAVIDQAYFGGNNAAYAEAMVKRRTMVFGSFAALENQYFRRYAPMIWSYWPDVEHSVDIYTSYVCAKIASFDVANAGTDNGEQMNGKPRKYALMYTTDPIYPGLQHFARLAKEGLQNCPNGRKLDIAVEITFPRAGFSIDSDPETALHARENIAKLRQKKVTTVLWLGGTEANHPKAARGENYFPEWVIAGDQLIDTLDNAQEQDPEAFKHAWVVTNLLREGRLSTVPSRQAYRYSDPDGGLSDEDEAASAYRDYFLLFKSIQVAGPRLTPQSVDQGQHAIPKQRSTNPFIAACFYDAGDYSCVKDGAEQWWDPNAADPLGGRGRGCWRMVDEGQRYLAGTWPDGPTKAFANPEDPCNTANTTVYVN